jgi:predicted Zn finger-like uncharacterized protein
MTDWVVACPECGTHFRVTGAHRDAAGGLVRCGACLGVFRAADRRVGGRTDDGVAERVAARGDALDEVHARRHRSVLELPPEEVLARGLRSVREDLDAGAPSAIPVASPTGPAPGAEAPPEVPTELPPPRTPRRGVTLAWTAVLVLGLVGLAAQGVIWRFDVLALDPATRPALVRLCELVGCRVPSPLEPDAIRSRGLMVRTHPRRDDGLLADAVLVNESVFPQPFPELELRFSDIRGELLAQRRFAPAEYLAGELAGRREMPSGAPVRISLALADPGPEAVNYEMRLHPRRP